MIKTITTNTLRKATAIIEQAKKQNRLMYYDTFYSLDNDNRIKTEYLIYYKSI